jgi:hypothetical protein
MQNIVIRHIYLKVKDTNYEIFLEKFILDSHKNIHDLSKVKMKITQE